MGAFARGKLDRGDPLLARISSLYEQSGLTLDQLAKRMGITHADGRKTVWQFLNYTRDHRVSTLRKFAAAVGVKVSQLFVDDWVEDGARQ